MRTRAIILKKQPVNEYDQLITCYTQEFGRITAVAKSIFKPVSIQAMHLDIFNLVDFELVNGKTTPIITGAQAESVYPELKNNLSHLAAAYFFAETANKLFFDYQRDDELWDFFSSLLEELNAGQEDISGFFKSKQSEFIQILGYEPELAEYATNSLNLFSNVIK